MQLYQDGGDAASPRFLTPTIGGGGVISNFGPQL